MRRVESKLRRVQSRRRQRTSGSRELGVPVLVAALWLTVLPVARAYPRAGDATIPSFVNWESPHVHPLDITPDGSTLLAVNTADNRLEVFDISGPGRIPVLVGEVPVGLDPVSVRARTNDEAWVVNHVSDTVSIVSLTTRNVAATLAACDEPADVAFAGQPRRAFVSCAQESRVLVFDPRQRGQAPTVLELAGEEPKALAVSPDGATLYAAIFESGNQTSILGSRPPRIIDLPEGPYGGQNPPPNRGTEFDPPINPALPVPPPLTALIIQRTPDARWVDDNAGDWTPWVSGPQAHQGDREFGWNVIDNDVAAIDASTLEIRYLTGLMNLNMALAVRPGDGKVTVVGTQALNVVRYVANLKAHFVRVHLALADPAPGGTASVLDLNPHLTYSAEEIATQSDPATYSRAARQRSIGDPRAIVWNRTGSRGFVAGMGSNNVIVIDAAGDRIGAPIRVGAGPTGLALRGNRLYVMNKFGGTISTIDAQTRQELGKTAFFDPTPASIKDGRPFQYDTHRSSALGQISCASCHVDARTDRLAWDLGDPAGEMTPFGENCNYEVINLPGDVCSDFHPMKGPMLTQTLQDIIGNEPLHWRGDKTSIEAFNPAFTGLQGREALLTETEMERYRAFLATIFFPPNPYRGIDNALPSSVALPGHFSSGMLAPQGGLPVGSPMPPGDPRHGEEMYRLDFQHTNGPGPLATCRMCHTYPMGSGADVIFIGDATRYPRAGSGVFEPILPGTAGEHFLMTATIFFADAPQTFKVPQLRDLYKRVGFERTQAWSRSGFGFFNDGSDSLEGFLSRFVGMETDQEIADFIAFLLSFSGSDLPAGSLDNLLEPPGPPSQDSHAAVGRQITFRGPNAGGPDAVTILSQLRILADEGKIGLVVKGRRDGVARGWTYLGAGVFQADHEGELIAEIGLRSQAGPGAEITFTAVPYGSQTRIGIDRDSDGIFDADDAELAAGLAQAAIRPRPRPVALRAVSKSAH